MTRVLITGARAPVALDMARAFRAAGCRVGLADSVRPHAALLSRPGFAIHRLPPPRFAFEAFRARLRGLMTDVDLLVPTCEEVFWLAAAAARDGWADRLFAPGLAALRELHSKVRFPALARAAGIDAPITVPLAARADLDRLIGRLPHLVLKPEFCRFGGGTHIAPTRAAVRGLIPRPDRRWVAQELIEGDELCVWSAMRGGRLVACVVYRPLLRHGRSASYAFEAVDRPDIVAMARRIAQAVGGDGQLSYDVIVTPGGRIAPLECNPRTVSGIHLFDASPALARALLDGSSLPPPPAGRIRYLSPAMVLMGVPVAVARGALPLLWRIGRSGRDSVGRRGDRLPVAGVLLDAARFALLGLTRRHGPTGETTDDIEWNGEAIP